MANKLPGDYIAGFVDGEGCFALKYNREVKHHRPGKPVFFRWDIEFAIYLKAHDMTILESIRDTIGCGIVNKPNKAGAVRFAVNDILQLKNIVIPFFEKYELRAIKRHDFNLWKEAVDIFIRNQRQKINAQLGKDGFQRTEWNQTDLNRLNEIKIAMEEFKGGNRHTWKWLS
jgi:hypothetical protein